MARPPGRPARGKISKVTIDSVTVFLGVKIDAENRDMLGDFKDFSLSHLLGVKFDAKKGRYVR